MFFVPLCGLTALEVKLQAELNLSRISRREELPELTNGSEVRDAVKGRVGRQSIRNSLEDVVKNRLIENIEELRTELKFIALGEVKVLRQIHIRKELAWEAER